VLFITWFTKSVFRVRVSCTSSPSVFLIVLPRLLLCRQPSPPLCLRMPPIAAAWSLSEQLRLPSLGRHLWAAAFGFGAPPAASVFGVQVAASGFKVQAAASPSSFVSRPPPPPPRAVELWSPLIALPRRYHLPPPSSLGDFGARSSSRLDLVFGSGRFRLVHLQLG
jgi:hypothetical protein